MAKPKPPRWLTASFADGVVELAPARPKPAYRGALGRCWLAQHDPRCRPCELPLDRAHLIPRQRVENALGALLGRRPNEADELSKRDRDDLILLAAYDPRNAVIGCRAHHRRLDNHATPALVIPQSVLPAHIFEFASDYGLEAELERRFP